MHHSRSQGGILDTKHTHYSRTRRALDAVSYSLRHFTKPPKKALHAVKRKVNKLTKKRHFSVTPATVAKVSGVACYQDACITLSLHSDCMGLCFPHIVATYVYGYS